MIGQSGAWCFLADAVVAGEQKRGMLRRDMAESLGRGKASREGFAGRFGAFRESRRSVLPNILGACDYRSYQRLVCPDLFSIRIGEHHENPLVGSFISVGAHAEARIRRICIFEGGASSGGSQLKI